ncbi:MAG: outer membrane lipid asymmetry maintenance protein MlaD [Alphaproteobacteria bacterium]
MQRSAIETVMGAVVLVVAGFFVVLAYNTTDIKPVSGYQLQAKFNAVDGLAIGSDVRIGGVKVGSVIDQYVDQELYQAVVSFSIQDKIRLPADSVASVNSSGLLGEKYLAIKPGTATDLLSEGQALSNTKDVVSLEELIGRVIFLVSEE